MRFALLVFASLAVTSPVHAQEADASTSSGGRVALELAGGLLGAGLAVVIPTRIAMKNMEERDASARHCMMEDADCWQWIEIGPFVGPTLLYGVMAPLTTALGVSIAGHAAGSSSNFGFAIVGATLGMGPAAVLTLAAAYGGDETAYLSLIVGGTLLPALGSVLFHEIGHNAIERRKRVSAFTLQPLATVTSDGRGALIGASGTF